VSSIKYIVYSEEKTYSVRILVSQFADYPVEELKSGWLTVLTNSFIIVTKKLYLKLTSKINW